ncbi:D-alanyl-D-alanine carboxypeptidase family protein [Bengtsoniella intestinalis]|uniref:D-alanyl-D-alanine carboxypeptidase family protein n=1 Tax=Bengtsoniella intestinalis TaxID=3073143 RepID=UPI00391F0729
MISYIRRFIYTTVLVLLSLTSVCATDIDSELALDVPYAVLLDATSGEVLFSQNAYQRTYPASTTKIMTGLLVVEAVESGLLTQAQLITCTEAAFNGMVEDGSTQNIVTGEALSVDDLLHCLLMSSANEAANILAIAVAGDEASFVALMNQRATELGCIDTHFINAHGLHNDDHYTTAYDIGLLLQEAMTHPLFAQIAATSTYTTAATEYAQARTLHNSNALISDNYASGYLYEQAIGGKTGYTKMAGRCLATMAQEDDSVWISVVMGGENLTQADGSVDYQQFSQSIALLDWGFSQFQTVTLSPSTASVTSQLVNGGDAESVAVTLIGDITATLPTGVTFDDFTLDLTLNQETIEAPVSAGQLLGTCSVSYEGTLYGQLDLQAVEAVSIPEPEPTPSSPSSPFTPAVMVVMGLIILCASALIWLHRPKPVVASRRRYSRYK